MNSIRFFPLFESADVLSQPNSSHYPTRHLKHKVRLYSIASNLKLWNCEMEKYNLVKKCGREFSDAFTLLCYPLPIFKFLTEIHMKTPPIVTPLSK